MKQYKVTLNFTFEPEYVNDNDGYDSDEGYASANYNDEDTSTKVGGGRKSQNVGHRAAFERTEAYYEEHSVEEHVKENDPMGFVECVLCDGEVVSAAWDKEKFQIHMVVNTDQTKEGLIRDLEMNSLEDGEYEACGDTGWIVMTRGPKGEVFDGDWTKMKEYWVYGLTDYRQNPIEVELIGDVPEVPELKELVTLNEKGALFHAKMKEMKETGRYLSSEEEKVFNVLCTMIGDKKIYGTRIL